VVLEQHPPSAGSVSVSLIATAVAVGLAELYSEIVGAETRTHRRVTRPLLSEFLDDTVAVTFGVAFPVIFFELAVLGVLELDTAFAIARWSGLGLIGFYGYAAGRLSGARPLVCVLQAVGVAAIGGLLIAIKALVH
jgi:VIT1/CCC1 family predicted Fe2+/Mn2+ transporter